MADALTVLVENTSACLVCPFLTHAALCPVRGLNERG